MSSSLSATPCAIGQKVTVVAYPTMRPSRSARTGANA